MNLVNFRLHRPALTAALILLSVASALAQGAAGGRGGGAGGGAVGGGGGGGAAGASTRSYQNTTMVGDATFSSDVDTRNLMIVTDPQTYEKMKAVIAALDKPKPQVLINVVFMQVTHDNSFDLGAEAKWKGPVSISTNPNGTATTKFGLANQILDNVSYGAFYQLVGRDITATVKAMAGVTKTEVLSRPSILTRSNQQATILVGQSVPIVTGTQVAQTTGAITNTYTYQNVGIILKVTPFITSDGLVEMIVSPEISSISAQTVAGQTVIDKRNADTVVVTKSDQTIVIGGLMSSQKNDTETKVPILGDIPLIGFAFKHKVSDKVKSELLIFLTPHVVARPDDLAGLAASEQAHLNMTEQAFDKGEVDRFIPKAKIP